MARKYVLVFMIICWGLILSVSGKDIFNTILDKYIYPNFTFLPTYHLETDVNAFFLQKSEYFKHRYYLESNTSVEFEFVNFRDFLSSVWEVEIQTGLGQTPGNVVFDVMDICYGITPALEYRLPAVNIDIGLEHHCFHEVDRKDFPVTYWNRFFLGAGSRNMRSFDYWHRIVKQEKWTVADRFSWQCRGEYYLRDFFGLVGENKLNGYNPNTFDLKLELRYALATSHSWLFNLRTYSFIASQDGSLDGSRDPVWRQDLAMEMHFTRSEKAGMIFVMYTLDDYPLFFGVPRFSKDKLLTIGIKFYI